MSELVTEVLRRLASDAGFREELARAGLGDDPARVAELVAHVLAAAAEYERELASTRTKEGMAARKADGAHVGRPRVLPESVVARIVAERGSGRSYVAIARGLSDDGVPTARGGDAWNESTVRRVLARA